VLRLLLAQRQLKRQDRAHAETEQHIRPVQQWLEALLNRRHQRFKAVVWRFAEAATASRQLDCDKFDPVHGLEVAHHGTKNPALPPA
jgi:hypothetical protein